MSKRKRTILMYRVDDRRYTVIISTRADGSIHTSTRFRVTKKGRKIDG